MRNKDRYARGGACGATACTIASLGNIVGIHTLMSVGITAMTGWKLMRWKGEETCEGDSLETVTFMHFFIGAHSSWP